MKFKTALITIIICVLNLFCVCDIYADDSFYAGGGDVNIGANINQDLYSQLDIAPSTVEISQPSTVELHMLDSEGNPKPDRVVTIYVNGSSTGVSITQPSISNSNGYAYGTISSSLAGTYEVCAKDTTDALNIYILDCETLYVVPVAVPNIASEPQYTKGTTNSISWNTSGIGTYTYMAQISTSSSFGSDTISTNWLTTQTYEFENLENGEIYFYRVRAKNAYGAKSGWSNLVFSVQDSSSPEITFLSVTGLGSNTTKDWDAQDVLTFKIRIKDNIGINSRHFWCVLSDGNPQECMDSDSVEGDIWTVKVKLGDLEHDTSYNLYTQYSFCVEALDLVGNVNRVCNISLAVPESTTKPPNPVVPVIEKIKDTVNEILDNSFKAVQNTIGRLNTSSLQQISITVTVGNLLVGMGVLIGGMGTVPYVLLQLFLAISSLFGFRKKGIPTGYVYDSITKEPLSLCVVRVFNESNTLVWTDVTDGSGYFRTNEVQVGEYSVAVTGRGYEFPSKIIFGKTDFPLENVYHGQEFYCASGNIPKFSIPMDKKDMGDVRFVLSQFAFITKVLWKFLHVILFLIGLTFSAYALYASAVWYNYLIMVMYAPSLLILLVSLFSKKEKYGVVKDKEGNRLRGVVVGLKEKEFGNLVSKRVTDENGRFRFFVNPGVYDLAILSPEWTIGDVRKAENIRVKREGLFMRNLVLNRVEKQKKKVVKVKVEEVLEPLEEL